MANNIALQDTYFSLSAIVDHVCNSLRIPVAQNFQWMLDQLTWGLVQLNLNTAQSIRIERLPISEVLTVKCPPDYIDWVGVYKPHGQYWIPFTYNDSLSAEERNENSEFSKFLPPGTLPNGVDIRAYGGYEFASYGGRSLYSPIGSLPSTGQFKVVKRDDCYEILFDTGLGCEEILLEYVSLGLKNCNGQTVVAPVVGEWCLRYGLHKWEVHRRGPERSRFDIDRTGRDVWEQEMIVKAYKGCTPKDFLQAQRRNYRLTNKI